MFFAAGERREPRSQTSAEGVRVTFPNDVSHWFAGPEALALAMAERVCPAELFFHPGTTVEAGEMTGRAFLAKKLIRGPKLPAPPAGVTAVTRGEGS